MKNLMFILSLIFLISCGNKENRQEGFPPPPPHPDIELHEEHDSILEERKKKMMDRLTEKLGLTEDQIREVKKIEDSYANQLHSLRKQMKAIRKEHHQLSEEKREKIKSILTPEQIEKLETLRKNFKERKHKPFKEKKHH